MLENFLTDELTLPIAVGGEPNPFGAAQGLANGPELGGFVAALCRASAVKAFRPQKDRRPALPGRYNILWFEQVEQMAFGRETVSYTHLRAHETVLDLVCRLLLEKKKKT